MDPLERDLRQSLSGRKWDLSGDPGLLERVHAGARRRRTTRRSVVAAGVAAALVSAITVTAAVRQPLSTSPSPAGTHTSAPPLTTVPWVDDEVPDPYADVPACRASDLQVIRASAVSETGITLASVTVENRGPAACLLSGEPRLRAQGIEILTDPNAGLVEGFSEPGVSPALLKPGFQATTTFNTVDDCVDPGDAVKDVTLVLGTGGVVHTTLDLNTRCHASINSWLRTKPESEESPWQGIRASIRAPSTVRAGETLEYTVALTNAGPRPVEFATCPTYQQVLQRGQQVVTGDWRLNCGAVPVLEPKDRVRFAMRLPVPADMPARRALLTWILEGSSAFGLRPVTVIK